MRDLSWREHFVLGVLLDDVESVETMLPDLNHPGVFGLMDPNRVPFTSEEVTVALKVLIGDGLVVRKEYDQDKKVWRTLRDLTGDLQNDWFDLTREGRKVSLSWLERQKTSQ